MLAPILMIKGVTYALALIAMSVGQAASGIHGAWSFVPFSVVFPVGALVCSWLLLHNLRRR